MLNELLAQSIVDQLGACTDYNVNIINKSGYILASSDPNRIGKFHEIAYRMVQENIELMEVENNQELLGVKPGINMMFYYHRRPAGIVGITGKVETIRLIAPIIRKSVELMLECELGKNIVSDQKSEKERLLNYLLYVDFPSRDIPKVLQLFDRLGYRRNLPRIPLLLSVTGNINPEQLLKKAKQLLPLSVQDILTLNHDGQLILFLSYTESLDGFFENYRFYIGDYLKKFLLWCRSINLSFCIHVGPMQINPCSYKFGYEKTIWLKENIQEQSSCGVYFYEHIGEYFRSQLPLIELHQIFDVFSSSYSSDFTQRLMSHMEALHENNYNFQQSSNQLFIHKNTLAFRLDKIREQLGADPIQNLKDRELVEYLCYYLHQLATHQIV